MNALKRQKLNEAFSPTAPIQTMDLFLGRLNQLGDIVDTVMERGQHFVLFGERGVGKTSLANIMPFVLKDILVAKVTCSRSDSFRVIWEKALNKVRFTQASYGMGFHAEKQERVVQLDLFLPDKDDISSLDVQNTLESVNNNLLFIFDEYDSIADPSVKGMLADTIKSLSDNCSHVTTGLVGIAQNVNDLVGEHPSLERCLKQIQMPKMSQTELASIIEKGLDIVGLEMEESVKDHIIDFSLGFPHFTHLLAKHSCMNALNKESERVVVADFNSAVKRSLSDVNQVVVDLFRRATHSNNNDTKFLDVLSACSIADVDEYGTFTNADVVSSYLKVTGKEIQSQSLNYNLKTLCREERGPVLLHNQNTKRRYGFISPLLKAYARLHLYDSGFDEQQYLQLK
ncbi:hypothetical protein QEH52_02045 [Coraliomargarita sp. SDUM461003]|uniref:AAA+ ATPase domain-containing protein n=1 Tax=Thalassobacterium maritimum TaxID=3041265 RepID=A0ABU1ATG3_9BACT|nr:hypothetical protein [Coraliomargarita sp. SDUM461003]MDQ8206272.1 hypothetical protein [Coraliomargarita sp. SDUM461003]